MLALKFPGPGDVHVVRTVPDRPLLVGRAPSNDLILRDPMVSEHHAVLWREGPRVWLRDLGSSNGTQVNGARPDGSVELTLGDRVAFGETEAVLVERGAGEHPQLLVLEERKTGVCVPLVRDRVRVGSTPDADLNFPGGPDHVLTLFVSEGSLWLGTDAEEREVGVDEPFEVAGLSFVVRRARQGESQTVVPTSAVGAPLYDVEAQLDSATGPLATVAEGASGKRCRILSENRVALLYLLAQAHEAGSEDDPERGWCDDEDLCRGVWGRNYRENQLNVLVYRLRAEVRKAGLDPWFLEKRRGFTRIRVRGARAL